MTLSRFSAISGRIVFGLSAILYGVLCLMWHDPDTWQSLRTIWALPLGSFIGICLMVVQIAGGIAIMLPRTARPASIALAVVYAVFTLSCFPFVIQAPLNYGSYVELFEIFALVVGAIAVFAATQTNDAKRASLGRTARIALGICTVSFALAQYFYPKITASLVPTWIPPNQFFWMLLTTVAFALAAVSILTKLWARLALRLLTLMIVLFGILVWIPLTATHPESHNNWSELALNFLIAGACWVVAELPIL